MSSIDRVASGWLSQAVLFKRAHKQWLYWVYVCVCELRRRGTHTSTHTYANTKRNAHIHGHREQENGQNSKLHRWYRGVFIGCVWVGGVGCRV